MSTADAENASRPAEPPVSPTASAATASADVRGGSLPRASAADLAADRATPRGCPFLVAEAGGWRLGVPSREHRCGAFTPPASLAPEKQSRLCLTATYTGCATYVASLSARTQRVGATPVRRATRWGLARTTTVIEDRGGVRGRLIALVRDRGRWPAVPTVILVTTLFVLALSGLRGGLPATAVSTASPGPLATQTDATASPNGEGMSSPGASPSLHPTVTPESVPPATSQAPEVAPTTQPGASFRTYRVKSGDTLGAIARRFDTTVSALVALNQLADAGRLSIGQVLLLP